MTVTYLKLRFQTLAAKNENPTVKPTYKTFMSTNILNVLQLQGFYLKSTL